MSYLSTPRFSFIGRFISDVSTLNNVDTNYEPGADLLPLWNPGGMATFEFIDCRVSSALSVDGAPDDADPALRLAISGAIDQPSAKMVDLDPAWQMSSEIWGLKVRAYDPVRKALAFEGAFDIASFRDLYVRQATERLAGTLQNGQPAGARFISTLRHVTWGPVTDESAFLRALRDRTEDNTLSIALHQFGYFYPPQHGQHATGSLAGTIGPWSASEPSTSLVARRLQALSLQSVNGIFIGAIDFELDEVAQRLNLDVGHALLIDDVNGTPTDLSTFLTGLEEIVVGLAPAADAPIGTPFSAADLDLIGDLDAVQAQWYPRASVVQLDVPADLVTPAATNPLALYGRFGTDYVLLSRETDNGIFVRTDRYVSRLDPGDSTTVTFHARQFGKPAEGMTIHLQPQWPSDGSAPGLTIPDQIVTDAEGRAQLHLTATSPGNPRGALDGQIFVLTYSPQLDEKGDVSIAGTGLGQLDVVVAHVRDETDVPDTVEFNAHVRPIMAQYAHLYPIMSAHLFDLASYDALVRYRNALLLAFNRPIEDPNYMPVTRDLSRAKLDLIIKWLETETGDPAEPLLRGAQLESVAERAVNRRALTAALEQAETDAKLTAAAIMAPTGVLEFPEPSGD
jgi:hypothetical protein